MSDIKRIIEHIEFEYEFATDDERLNSSLSVDERDELFITAAIEHLEEICRDFDTQHYNSIETGYLFNDAAATAQEQGSILNLDHLACNCTGIDAVMAIGRSPKPTGILCCFSDFYKIDEV